MIHCILLVEKMTYAIFAIDFGQVNCGSRNEITIVLIIFFVIFIRINNIYFFDLFFAVSDGKRL